MQREDGEKKKSFRVWQRTKTRNIGKFIEQKKKVTKRQVAQARRIVLEEWSQNLTPQREGSKCLE